VNDVSYFLKFDLIKNKTKQNKTREKGFRIQAAVWKNFEGVSTDPRNSREGDI